MIKQVLQRSFPNAADITVEDISGGCGAMFQVVVVSDEFKGVTKVKQHMSVSKVTLRLVPMLIMFTNFQIAHFLGIGE